MQRLEVSGAVDLYKSR